MAQKFSKSFYNSEQWKICRDGYISSVNGMCERCLKQGQYVPGYIVHHKIHLSPKNINDPNVTLNWDNLEYVCLSCHSKEHTGNKQSTVDGLRFNDKGELVQA